MGSGPPDDLKVTTSNSLPAASSPPPEEQDNLEDNVFDTLSPIKSDEAALYTQRYFPNVSTPSPVFASADVQLEQEETFRRLESKVDVGIEEDHRADETVKLSNKVRQEQPMVSVNDSESALPENILDYTSADVDNFMGNDEKEDKQLRYGAHRHLQFESGGSQRADETVKLSNKVQQRQPMDSLNESESALLKNLWDYTSADLVNLMGNDEKEDAQLGYGAHGHQFESGSQSSWTQTHETGGSHRADETEDAQLGYGAHRHLQFESCGSQSSWTQTHINAPVCHSPIAPNNLKAMVSPGFQDKSGFIGSETANPAIFMENEQFQGQVPNSFAIPANNSINSAGTKVDLQQALSKGSIHSGNAGKDVQIGVVSPATKRKRSIITKRGEEWKPCNCKQSQCQKLYCDCFSARRFCSHLCACENCENTLENEAKVMETRQLIETRNPQAFAPKVVRDTMLNVGEQAHFTAASSRTARHKKGCNCKKSYCFKNYCECYQSKVGCSIACRCESCQNPHGKKEANVRSANRNTLHREMPYTAEGITHSTNIGNTNKLLARNALHDISNLPSYPLSCVDPTALSNSCILGDRGGYAPVTQLVLDPTTLEQKTPSPSLPLQSYLGNNDVSYPTYAPRDEKDNSFMTHIDRGNRVPANSNLFSSYHGIWSAATSSSGLRNCQNVMRPSFPSLTAPGASEEKTNQSSNEGQNNSMCQPAYW